jgi:hypothetical protein
MTEVIEDTLDHPKTPHIHTYVYGDHSHYLFYEFLD